MQLLSTKIFTNSVMAILTTATIFLANPLVQAQPATADPIKVIEEVPVQYLPTYPWLGLLMDKVYYGPITISNIHFDDGGRLAIVQPGEVLHGSLHYRIDTSQQEFLHRYHLTIGIADIGAQDCVSHNFSVWNTDSGTGTFTLKAPLQPGVYQVRFSYQEAPTCEEARSVWNNESGEPSGYATIGIIIVK
jgi:hypothetical protein